jgi:hypothetical protein
MTWTYDIDGNLNLSDLSMEERVEVIKKVTDHLAEIRWAWEEEFSPERVEVGSGQSILEEMNETELEELNSILDRYDDNQIWTVSHADGTGDYTGFSGTIYPLPNMLIHVNGCVIMLGKQSDFNGNGASEAYYYFTSKKPKVETAKYEKLIEVNHPKSLCEAYGCNHTTYEYLWDIGLFSCPFCISPTRDGVAADTTEELHCDHMSENYVEAGFEGVGQYWDFDTK